MIFRKRGTMTGRLNRCFFYLLMVLNSYVIAGCSPSSVNYKSESSSVLCVGDNCGGGNPQQQNIKPEVALLNQSQLLSSLIACTGITASDTTLNKYRSMKSYFSQEGKAGDMTSPLALAAVTIAGEVCKDLVNAESPKTDDLRKFFRGFGTLNASSAAKTISQESLATTVEVFAKSCYSRSTNPEEVTKVQEAFNSASFQTTGTTKQSAIYICSLLLSSAAALHY